MSSPSQFRLERWKMYEVLLHNSFQRLRIRHQNPFIESILIAIGLLSKAPGNRGLTRSRLWLILTVLRFPVISVGGGLRGGVFSQSTFLGSVWLFTWLAWGTTRCTVRELKCRWEEEWFPLAGPADTLFLPCVHSLCQGEKQKWMD